MARPLNTDALPPCIQYISGGLFKRSRSCTRGTIQPCHVSLAIIWRLACANRDSSRSIAGIPHCPGTYSAMQTRTRAKAAQGPRVNPRHHRRRSIPMLPKAVRIARDYNRGLSTAVRWAHAIGWTLEFWFRPLIRAVRGYWMWASEPPRGWYLRPITLGVLVALAFLPFDGPIAHAMNEFRPGGRYPIGGDIRLTLNTMGQFGDLATSVLIAWGFYLVGRQHRARMLDWALTMLAMFIAANVLKMALGRARPFVGTPFQFLAPWNSHPIETTIHSPLGVETIQLLSTYSWQFWDLRASRLWSMPSSHTSAAVVLALIMIRLSPRLAPIAWTCAAFVAFNRVFVGMHYPSDVAIGVVIGVVSVRGIFDRRVATRLRLANTPPHLRPIPSRVGRIPALANAIRVQRGESILPEQTPTDAPPPPG